MLGRSSITLRSSNLLLQHTANRIMVVRCKQCALLDEKQPKCFERPFLWHQIPQGRTSVDLNKFVWSINNGSRYENKQPSKRTDKITLKGCDVKSKIQFKKASEQNFISRSFIDEQQPKCPLNVSNNNNLNLLQQPFTARGGNLPQIYKEPNAINICKNKSPRVENILTNCSIKDAKMDEVNLDTDKKNSNITFFNIVTEKRMNDKHAGLDPLILEKVADQLNTQFMMLFKSDLDLSLFSNNIYFENTILKVRSRGINLYRVQVLLFKWLTKMLWADPLLQILQSTKHTEDNSIRIRWQVTGRPRILYPLLLIGRVPSVRYQDFFSLLHVEEEDKIIFHRLTKVVPSQTTKKRNPLLSLLALLGLSGTKMHIPELQEEPIIPSSSEAN